MRSKRLIIFIIIVSTIIVVSSIAILGKQKSKNVIAKDNKEQININDNSSIEKNIEDNVVLTLGSNYDIYKMSEEEIFQALKELIVEQLGVDEEKVTMEAAFTDDLGADSLDVVELVMSIEERFNVEISDDQADKILEVKNLVDYIKNNI